MNNELTKRMLDREASFNETTFDDDVFFDLVEETVARKYQLDDLNANIGVYDSPEWDECEVCCSFRWLWYYDEQPMSEFVERTDAMVQELSQLLKIDADNIEAYHFKDSYDVDDGYECWIKFKVVYHYDSNGKEV